MNNKNKIYYKINMVLDNNKKSLFQGLNDSFKKLRHSKSVKINESENEYYYIRDFENTTDEECIKFDKINEKIYLNNLKIFNDTNIKLSKLQTRLKLKDPPQPPEYPTNLEKLYLWRQRNVKLNVYNQTISILYLLSKNISLKLDDNKDGVEPHNAIEVAREISEGKDMKKDVYDFIESLNNNSLNNQITCINPEYHNVHDKVKFYSNNSYPSLNSVQPSAPPYKN